MRRDIDVKVYTDCSANLISILNFIYRSATKVEQVIVAIGIPPLSLPAE